MMQLLIEKGLMFGGLIEVASPALVERYNRALKHLTGKTTALANFHIDLSGFSPEVGDELGDDHYLNPNGCNRQFILLSTEQARAPLLNVTFSTDWGVLTQFIAANEPQLFALTAKDAVAGELMDSVYDVSTPDKLLDYRKVTVEADTVGAALADATRLEALIGRFRTEPGGWRDADLIDQMIGLARNTGDVTRAPVTLGQPGFEQPDFWTSHFGGVYVFRSVASPATITVAAHKTIGDLPVPTQLDLSDRNQIAQFLEVNGLAEPIVTAKGADAAAILQQKMDFVLVDAAFALGLAVGQDPAATRRDLRAVAQRLGPALPEEFNGLAALLRWVQQAGDWPRLTSQHPAYFYALRAKPGPLRDLVNMVLSELSPLDVRQMFICHKELFYRSYRGWPAPKQAYVAEFLSREYMVDRAGARTALFGAEPGMEMPVAETPEDVIARVGPWGAATGRAGTGRAGTGGRR